MVLVTGATGHVGNVLVRELLTRGERVRACVYPGEDTSSLCDLDVERVEVDVLVPGSIRDALVGVDYVYHLAGLISIGDVPDELVHRVNVEGTRTVAVAAREAGVRRMVYVSSIHALVRPEDGVVIDEALPFDPDNPAGEYDRSKAEASLAVLELVESGLDAVIVCPTGIIGPYDFRGSELGRTMAGWMTRRPHMMIDGHFDFVDVRDVVDGMIRACRRGRRGEVYVLSGRRVSIEELRRAVQEAAGVRSALLKVPTGIAMAGARIAAPFGRVLKRRHSFTTYSIETIQSNSVISSAKARRELGYLPRDLSHTVADTVAWLRTNGALQRHPKWYGKVALITGASSGIGEETAYRLADLGMVVLLVARRRDRLDEIAGNIRAGGGRADVVAADLTRKDAVDTIVEHVRPRYHGVDVLVNNAGMGWYGFLHEMHRDTAEAMVALNNQALVRLCLAFIPYMAARRFGRIVNVGSIAGSIASQGTALYSATKSFIDTLTRAASRELKGSGVRMSVIHPGPVATEFFHAARERSAGRAIPASSMGVPASVVAERIRWNVTGTGIFPGRRTVFVPTAMRVIPSVARWFGWIMDLLGPINLRKKAPAQR